jgi:beta-N-acetylglucosaminidase
MHDRSRRLIAAGLAGLLLAAAFAVPAAADTPHRLPVRKAEPRRVAEYRPNRPFTHDTDLLSESGYAAWMIDDLLQSTTSLPRLGAAFTQAERDTGINARYLVAHAILESGWGTSWIARVKRNLFGYGAYDRDPARYAVRFPSFKAGIAAVANQIRTAYLSPDGRWWRGFPTLRGVNRFYASDALWADKVAVLANAIDWSIVTLRERGLNFGWPRLASHGAAATAGAALVIEVPWTSRTLGLPAGIRFAFRWAPVALAEGGPAAVPVPPVSTWSPVAGTARSGHAVLLSLRAPATPGSWRLEIEARDSDGKPLPASDQRPIRPLALHIAAQTEATISIGLDQSPGGGEAGVVATPAFAPALFAEATPGGLVATIRNTGRTAIPASAADGTATVVEAWSLPLAADESAVQLLSTQLVTDLRPGGEATFRVRRPASAAVVVVRLTGDAAAIGRSLPAAVLFTPTTAGAAGLAQMRVPDLRDATFAAPAESASSAPAASSAPEAGRPPVAPRLAGRPLLLPRLAGRPLLPPPVAAAVSIVASGVPGELALRLVRASAPPLVPDHFADASPGPPSILVRTLLTLPETMASPTASVLSWPPDPAGNPASGLRLDGVPAGVHLVLVALVPDGSTSADQATLELTWVPIAESGPSATAL